MDVRQRFPDLPPALTAPTSNYGVTPNNNPAGTLLTGTYYFVVTQLTPFGESLPSAEGSFTIANPTTNAVRITVAGTIFPTLSPAASAYRIYVGTVSNGEQVYFAAPFSYILGNDAQMNILGLTAAIDDITGNLLVASPGTPPQRPTAFLPDSDGLYWGAFAMYRALKRALDTMVKICNGITDVTGVQAFVGQEYYAVPPVNGCTWMNFTNLWFDGYPIEIVPRRLIFERNKVVGFSGLASFDSDTPSAVFQLWPQPNREGGITTLSSAMLATDNVANVADTSEFLQLGIMQIDQEIMAFSQVGSSTQFIGLYRGLGGTVPAAHASGVNVTELNIRIAGKRLAPIYTVGQAEFYLAVPPAWDTLLADHMLAQMRSSEGDDAGSEALMKDFAGECALISRGSNGPTKPRQIQIGSGVTGLDTYNVNGVGFGWLIS